MGYPLLITQINKNMKILFYFFISPLFAYCGLTEPWIDATFNKVPGVIISKDYIEMNLALFGKRTMSGWRPEIIQLEEIAQKLDLYLEAIKKDNIIKEDISYIQMRQKYSCRQFAGLIIDGKRIIRINVFPKPNPNSVFGAKNWEKEYILYYDGGAEFWNIDYTVDEEKFMGININSDP